MKLEVIRIALDMIREAASQPAGAWQITAGNPPIIIDLNAGAVPEWSEVLAQEAAATAAYEALLARSAPVEEQMAEAMKAARHAMAAILDALPMEDRAAVQTLRTAIEKALDLGQADLALHMLQHETIPEHLEPTRTALLALFPGA